MTLTDLRAQSNNNCYSFIFIHENLTVGEEKLERRQHSLI